MSSSNDITSNKKQKTIFEVDQPKNAPLKLSGNVKTIVFKFPNFKDLPHEQGQYTEVVSECHGYDWVCRLYPAACGQLCVCFGLFQGSRLGTITARAFVRIGTCKFATAIRNRNYTTEVRGTYWSRQMFDQSFDSDGSLTVEIDLDIDIPKREEWYPEIKKDVPLWSALYDEQNEANVELDINGSTIRFHKVALKVQAPGLYDLVEENDGKGPFPITGIDCETFAVIHRYIYTVFDVDAAGTWDSLEKTQSILQAADKFGCTSLKLYAESVLTNKFLMPDTCAVLLVLADSHSCPLLKEAAKDMHKEHPIAVYHSEEWKNLMMDCPKLLSELLYASTLLPCSFNEDKVETWDVPMLRKKLQDAKLDLDGSKEMLVKRWKDHAQTTNK